MKKNLVIIIALAALAGGAWMFFGKEEKKDVEPEVRTSRPVKTMLIEGEVAASKRTFPGAVQATSRVDVAFRVAGKLIELPIIRGSEVQKDAMLAKLDPRDFESQVKNASSALEGAKAQLASMRTGRKEDVASLEAALKSAQARLTEATSQFQRISNLFDKQAVAKTQYDQAKATLDVATANVASARQEVAKAKAGARPEDIAAQEAAISGLESQLKKAEDALKDTMLTAPFTGVIAELYVDNFQSVAADQKIAVLHDLRRLEVTVNLPGNLIIELQQKYNSGPQHDDTDEVVKAEATFSTIPNRAFPMKFKEIATTADTQTQTYATTFMMERPEDIVILPGIVANVNLSFANTMTGNGYILPPDAVIAGEGTVQYVWKVLTSGDALAVKKFPVTAESYSREGVVVTGGLETGDRIVTAGLKYLLDGDPVTLYEARP